MPITLGEVFRRFRGTGQATLTASRRKTLTAREKHLLDTLGADLPIQDLSPRLLQRYFQIRRQRATTRGKSPSIAKLHQEIDTLAMVWNWSVSEGLVRGAFPDRRLVYPGDEQESSLRTREEIERRIAQGGLSSVETTKLWNSLFLNVTQLGELLEYVRETTPHRWLYVMFCVAAHTGMRQSEILRSRVTDFDFTARTVLVREREKGGEACITRRVPLTPFLFEVTDDWLHQHSGGQYTFDQSFRAIGREGTVTRNRPLTVRESDMHLLETLSSGKWQIVVGWHVLRQSFLANCALGGVKPRMIEVLMGRLSTSTWRRCWHLFADQEREAIRVVFPEK